jgi:hypothetical protein
MGVDGQAGRRKTNDFEHLFVSPYEKRVELLQDMLKEDTKLSAREPLKHARGNAEPRSPSRFGSGFRYL